ncbi:MAG: hypothetical protein U0871_05645 [Gemmataceae bacterium]
MSRLSRLFAGVAVAAAVAAPARAAEIDPVLPAETESVVFVNVKQILSSELMKKYALGQLKQMLASDTNEAAKVLKDLGLDPFKDIDRVTGGIWGKQDEMNGVFVVKGTFDLEKMFAAAEKAAKSNGDKIAIVSEGKYKLVKFTNEKTPDRPIYATFADEKTIVGGTDKKLVITARETAEKGGKPQLKKDLAALILKQDEKASVYVCGLTDGKIDQLPPGIDQFPGLNAEKLQKQLETMRSMAMTLRLTEDVGLEVAMGMKDDAAAEDFGGTLSQVIGTVKGFLPLVTGQRPNLKPLVDELNANLKSKASGKEVTITLKLSADAIGKAAGGGD